MAVTTTEFTISTTGESFSVPGDFSSAQIVANYAGDAPAIRNMQATERVETRGDGTQIRLITFSPRLGNKG